MRNGEAMFRVLVLGGLALISSQEACGTTGGPAGDAGGDAAADAFPSELPNTDAGFVFDAGAPDGTPDATADDAAGAGDGALNDGFPQEGPPP
jgi:hypothetical protein